MNPSPAQAPATAGDVPDGVIRLVRLQREGALRAGDQVATRLLGVCEITTIESPHAIWVRRLADGTEHRIPGINFGPGAELRPI